MKVRVQIVPPARGGATSASFGTVRSATSRPHLQAQSLDSCLQTHVGLEFGRRFVARLTDIGGAQQYYRHPVVDRGHVYTLDGFADDAGGQQFAAQGPGNALER